MDLAGWRTIAAAGRASWPALAGEAEEFCATLAARSLDDSAADHAADLYLAWSCARGDAAALRVFEERYAAELGATARHAGLSAAAADDVVQEIRRRLLVGADGEPPRIAQYAGRADLASWLRVAALRVAIAAARKARREAAAGDALVEAVAPFVDIDRELVRSQYADDFRAAFAEAVAALAPRERTLLRYRYAEALTEEETARLVGAHRVSVARWVARARAKLLAGTRRRLRARLGLPEDEVASLIRVLHSQLALSLRRILGPQ